jgi:hypothetical protein
LLDARDATFRKFADEWLADHIPLWSASNIQRVRNRLERDLGSLPIGSIDSADILRVLRKIEARAPSLISTPSIWFSSTRPVHRRRWLVCVAEPGAECDVDHRSRMAIGR